MAQRAGLYRAVKRTMTRKSNLEFREQIHSLGITSRRALLKKSSRVSSWSTWFSSNEISSCFCSRIWARVRRNRRKTLKDECGGKSRLSSTNISLTTSLAQFAYLFLVFRPFTRQTLLRFIRSNSPNAMLEMWARTSANFEGKGGVGEFPSWAVSPALELHYNSGLCTFLAW